MHLHMPVLLSLPLQNIPPRTSNLERSSYLPSIPNLEPRTPNLLHLFHAPAPAEPSPLPQSGAPKSYSCVTIPSERPRNLRARARSSVPRFVVQLSPSPRTRRFRRGAASGASAAPPVHPPTAASTRLSLMPGISGPSLL